MNEGGCPGSTVSVGVRVDSVSVRLDMTMTSLESNPAALLASHVVSCGVVRHPSNPSPDKVAIPMGKSKSGARSKRCPLMSLI